MKTRRIMAARSVHSRSVCRLAALFFGILTTGLLIVPTVTIPARAQEPSKLGDMLHRLFATSEFEGKRFGPARWLEDGTAYTTVEPSATAGARDIVRYDTATGKREILVAASQLTPPGAKTPLAIEDYAWAKEMKRLLVFTNSRRVWRQNTRGDYWVLDRDSGKLRKLGGDAPESTLMFAKFSPDGTRAAYVRANNLYAEDLETGAITQLTHDGSETTINGTSDWVYEEEFDIRDGFRWSPDSRSIAYWQFDSTGVRDFVLLYNTGGPNDIVTHIPYPQYGVYPTLRHIPYPQPGTTNSAARVGVVGAAGGATRWMDVPGDPRSNYIPFLEWAGNSDELVMQHLNRLQNTNAVLLADARTGQVKEVTRDEDKAWVDVVADLRWLHDGKEFLWVSERDGWRQVYTVSRDGKNVRLVTPGAFDVISVEAVDGKDEWLYYIASPENATQRYLYRTRLEGTGAPQRLTPADAPGTHSYEIAPDCQWAFHTYSRFDSPPVIDLVRLPDHQVQRVLEANAALRAKVKPLVDPPVEFFKIDIGNGVTLDGWMIKPRSFNRMKKYPILINVYGEPAAQTVLDRWGGDGTLFHRAIANEGYLVASFDNRGTPAPKGRAWRKIVYGSVGVLSSKEQALALQALEWTRPYVDSKRVAVWGWSGGGTNTLNLMFRSPQLYKVGMAVAPVPDQRLYDTIYQERYMGLPQDNADGYKAGSAINFAEGLRGKLLLVHGSGDDNVHYQGSVLLINRLIELGKQFDFMEYPGRTHAIIEGKGTRFHLYSLLARYLEEHVPAGPVAPDARSRSGNPAAKSPSHRENQPGEHL
ncbi:MAG: S9 family peptidase [Terriglobia bacterium]